MRVAFYQPSRDRVFEVDALVADTPELRAQGFSGRTRIGVDESIFFWFDHDHMTPFTTAGTFVSLDIVFLTSDGRIVGIRRGQAGSREPYGPSAPYRHAIELPAGWLAGRGIDGSATVAWAG